MTPKHRKTKILATIPLKGKTEQRDLSLHVPLEVSDPTPLLERRPRRAAAPRVRGALRPDRCTSRLQINGLFAGATDTYHFAFIENVFHSRIADHSCVKHFKTEHKRLYENYFATVTSEYKMLVLPENENGFYLTDVTQLFWLLGRNRNSHGMKTANR